MGDDVNPCSRTAPCKTWAGAISKTASGGVIDALDPGGFGAVTITKPITLEGNGTLASTLHSGTNGIIINITTGTAGTKNVVLRNILIDGSGPTLGLDGVRFLAGDSLVIENCSIEHVSGDGIDFLPNATARLVVRNTTIMQAAGAGIHVNPSVGGVGRVSVSNTLLARNGSGITVTDVNGPSAVSVFDSNVVHNGDGIFANSTSASGITILAEGNEVGHNSSTGLRTAGANGRIRAANNLITGNTTGLSAPAGELCTFTNNRLSGNTTNGTFTGTCVPSNS